MCGKLSSKQTLDIFYQMLSTRPHTCVTHFCVTYVWVAVETCFSVLQCVAVCCSEEFLPEVEDEGPCVCDALVCDPCVRAPCVCDPSRMPSPVSAPCE